MLTLVRESFRFFACFFMVHCGVAKYNLSLYLSLYGLHRQVEEWDVEEALSYVLAVMVSIFLFALWHLIHQKTLEHRATYFMAKRVKMRCSG